jgi:hypothetical protein
MAVMKVAVISGGAWVQFEKQLLANLPRNDRLKQLSLLPTSGTKFLRYDGHWTQLRPPTGETLGRVDRGS